MMKPPKHSSTNKSQVKIAESVELSPVKRGINRRGRVLKFLLFVSFIFFLALGTAVLFLRPEPGRKNFLVLGVAGENYTGGDLTDTIIFTSTEPLSGRILILSLPRDIWITPWRAKLNAIYHYRGMTETMSTVEGILGQPINRYLLIDFSVFTQLVDALGGVEVEVENSFDDYRYPIPGKEDDSCGGDPDYNCRYEHVQFEKGRQFMDGQLALKYVRSRFAEGEEGTDFARNQRQQRLLLAIKEKALSPEVILNPLRIKRLFEVISANVKTNIDWQDYWDLLEILVRFDLVGLKMEVLNSGYLVNPPPLESKYDGQWVLVPASGDWQQVHDYVDQLLNGEAPN